MTATSSRLVLRDHHDRVQIQLDGQTGLPTSFTLDQATWPVSVSARLETEGVEIEGQPFGLAYAGTVYLDQFQLVSPDITHDIGTYEDILTVRTSVSGWDVDWIYRIRDRSPRIEVGFILAPAAGNDIGTLRNLHLGVTFAPDDPAAWRAEAPAASMRSGIAFADLADPAPVTEPTFSGSGIVVVHRPETPAALLIWAFSRSELLSSHIQASDGVLTYAIDTGLAGRIAHGERLVYSGIELDAFATSWDHLRPQIKSWYPVVGIASPADTPDWVPNASIFEVQIGKSVFWNGWEYSPYPEMRDLLNDIDRIAVLGFDCIQIMPRQPFTSYNVYDYNHVTISYGDEADLKRLVAAAHERGIKVILDILMHGVIDAEIIHRAADRVRNGPYFDRLNEGTDIVADEGFLAYQGYDYLVSWARHIIDFEPHWAGGSPGAHPLVAEHPEWFMRDSSGEIIGVYTKAFDVNNPGWQRYFTNAALDLVRRLDIDGFRFDAPTYNEFPNWSPATEKRASASQLGAVNHFQKLRYEMRQIQPDAVMYTEPAGLLFRQSMDITYNYDEHWLFHAVLRPGFALQKHPRGIRHARDLATWFRDKEAALPAGAITARHIDSHDSFWWPLPGFKWRREQYGLPATRAILAIWSLIGGVYMTFVGGETGIEDDIRKIHRLRRTIPELGRGETNFDAVRADNDGIFAMARTGDATTLVLVNLTNHPVATTIALDPSTPGIAANGQYTLHDAWNDESIATGLPGTALTSLPLTFAPYQPRVITIRVMSS
jgi:glycosidase